MLLQNSSTLTRWNFPLQKLCWLFSDGLYFPVSSDFVLYNYHCCWKSVTCIVFPGCPLEPIFSSNSDNKEFTELRCYALPSPGAHSTTLGHQPVPHNHYLDSCSWWIWRMYYSWFKPPVQGALQLPFHPFKFLFYISPAMPHIFLFLLGMLSIKCSSFPHVSFLAFPLSHAGIFLGGTILFAFK